MNCNCAQAHEKLDLGPFHGPFVLIVGFPEAKAWGYMHSPLRAEEDSR
jgi:hypothetical protein